MIKTTVFTRNKDATYRIIDLQAIILSPGDGCLHTLNEVGTFIWETMDSKKTMEDIIAAVCDEFDVDKKKAENDVFFFMGNLLRRGLIVARKIR